MQKTKEAIKYGLTTMGVTSKEMFSLIESSNGYTGEEYNRWLTSQIIKIAEADGVGYSQLLAKWFNIISSIEEDSADMSFKDKWVEKIQSMIGGGLVYTVGMGEDNDFGTELDDVNWFDGVDIAWNTWFTDEKLPEEASEAIHSGDPITFIINTDAKLHVSRSDSLVQDAKSNGVVCNSAGAFLLYRMCNMLLSMDYAGGFKVIVVSDTAFLLDRENYQILKYFLNHFSYNGFVINSMDLYESSFTSTDYAIMSCEPRSGDIQDGVVLPKVSSGMVESTNKRYSIGGNMWDKLCKDSESRLDCMVKSVKHDMSLSDEEVTGSSLAMGYICKEPSSRVPVLSTLPISGTVYVPIVKDNIDSVIAYYGVVASLRNAGLPCDIPEFLSGHFEYDMLVANCVPVFLFDIESKFCKYSDEIENQFDVEGSDFVNKLLDRSSQYYGYETKELVEVCKGFLDYIHNNGESMIGRTFEEIRSEADNSELNKTYISALSRCLDYIGTQYRRM